MNIYQYIIYIYIYIYYIYSWCTFCRFLHDLLVERSSFREEGALSIWCLPLPYEARVIEDMCMIAQLQCQRPHNLEIVVAVAPHVRLMIP